MNCEILETLYIKSNGEIPCNDDAGEQVSLGWIDADDEAWTIEDIFRNEHFERIRQSFPANQVPWAGVCENCAFFRSDEVFTDSLRQKRIRKLQVETSLACNLSCPSCANFSQVRSRAKPHIMQLRVFEKLVESIQRNGFTLSEVEYCGQGEPLMHPQFAEFPLLVTKYLPKTKQRLITNGNFDYSKTVQGRFLDEIFVSCDGVFQGSYEQYRRRGNVNKAIQFMQDVPAEIDGRKQLLVWKYILFEFNDSDEELIAAQTRANELGVDTLLFVFTHSEFKSIRYPPERAANLPIRYSNVVTNLTPIMFNREYFPATQVIEEKVWFNRPNKCRVVVDEVAVIKHKMLTLKGWALAADEIRVINIDFNGERLGVARLGLPREDVSHAFPQYDNPQSGFALSLSAPMVAEFQSGSGQLGITVELASGRRIKKQFTVYFDTNK